MTALGRVIKFSIGKADLSELASIARSRTEPAGRVERARVLLAYQRDPSFYAVGQVLGLHYQTGLATSHPPEYVVREQRPRLEVQQRP